jgi:Na+/H+ antiporter NhaD/arsenite permease-like protein
MRRALNLVVLVLTVGAFFIPPPFGMMPAGVSLGMAIVLRALR